VREVEEEEDEGPDENMPPAVPPLPKRESSADAAAAAMTRQRYGRKARERGDQSQYRSSKLRYRGE